MLITLAVLVGVQGGNPDFQISEKEGTLDDLLIDDSVFQPTDDGRAVAHEESAETFVATRYGESYNGSPLGCGDGVYSSGDPSILAAPPSLYRQWPCGTRLRVTNLDNGHSIIVVRRDACPGCGPRHVDLSEAGIAVLGGQDYLEGLVVEVLQ